MLEKVSQDRTFIVWLTLALLAAAFYMFRPYINFILVAAVLALATSHAHLALTALCEKVLRPAFVGVNATWFSALILSALFLLLIFFPLIYFVATSYNQVMSLDLDELGQTLALFIDKATALVDEIPLLKEPLSQLKEQGLAFARGPMIGTLVNQSASVLAGIGGLIMQIIWILVFYLLFNGYSRQILGFVSALNPMSSEHEGYLLRECTGTVAVVLYGTLFNMVAQGVAFGILMSFFPGYNSVYLGVLAGFCSVIPIVGAALVYVPVVVLELLSGSWLNALVIVLFAWVVMGFIIDNVLRMIFIGTLKRMFGFEYRMNEILIMLAILAGLATFGFWGLIIGPSILALALAAANLYSSGLVKDK
jgi:predicted PurR-regulated permease PerM